ncbi:ABC transporter ATP-binding protein [Deinococcus rubellus]|uniref:ABC transporter ATP-binding protein n=1 Tax=Deinococcus rubellus TaxID=1889240 RepID=UPI0028B19533|nr:ABC transporter ATP-binding protein [Deinococcus rubellus]
MTANRTTTNHTANERTLDSQTQRDFKQTGNAGRGPSTRLGSVSQHPAPPHVAPANQPRGAALELADVAYHYNARRGQRAGLGPLSLKVNAGEFLTVVGPSGSGKSTLLSVLAGFLKPQSGVLTLAGQPVKGPHPALTLVQQEHALFPWLTVAGNIAFGLKSQKLGREEQVRRTLDALEQVGLSGYGERRIHELSGGQRQRIALARALATRPGLLLLDEPFSALDARTRTEISQELLGIWQAQQVTVVFVTHNLDEALALGERVVALRGGQVVLDAPTGEVSPEQLRMVLDES